MTPFVDIFLTASAGDHEKFPATFCSALTQTYSNIRIILFLNQVDDAFENLLDKWWYTHEDTPRKEQKIETEYLTRESCRRGIILRNSNTEDFSIKWLFNMMDKSPYIKTLDVGDILIPQCIEYMMKYMNPNIDGIFIPIIESINYCFNTVLEKFEKNSFKSILFKRETMERMLSEGFVCSNDYNSTNKAFVDHCMNHSYKFGTTMPQNFLYLVFGTK